MKLKLLLTLLCLSVVFSCQQEENAKADFVNPYEIVGINHNLALDKAFIQFRDYKNSSTNRTYQGYLDIAENVSVNTVLGSGTFSTKGTLFIKDQGKEANRVVYDYLGSQGFDNFHTAIINDVQHLMTANQKNYVSQLMTIVTNDLDITESISRLKKLEVEVDKNCSADEKGMLLSSIAVAKHSLGYWNENFSKWDNEFGKVHSSAKTNGGPSGKVVAAADVAGAVCTGVVTSTALCVPFIGWAAWAGGVAAAGAICSVGTVVIWWAVSGYGVVDETGTFDPLYPTFIPALPYGAKLTPELYLQG